MEIGKNRLEMLLKKYGVNNVNGWLTFNLDEEDKFLVEYKRDTTKVGLFEHKEMLEENLEMGNIYKVNAIKMNDCFTVCFLDGVPNCYNFIHFDILVN